EERLVLREDREDLRRGTRAAEVRRDEQDRVAVRHGELRVEGDGSVDSLRGGEDGGRDGRARRRSEADRRDLGEVLTVLDACGDSRDGSGEEDVVVSSHD